MKIIRSRLPGAEGEAFDLEMLKKVDEREGRHRISGGEVEALIAFVTAVNIIRRELPRLESMAEENGQLTKLRTVRTMALGIMNRIVKKIAQDQLITIANNVYEVIVTLSSSPVEGCYNIRRKDLHTLADSVLLSCSMSCGKSRDESKDCPVRRALENIPGLKAAAKSMGNTKDCPFSGLEMEWEDDKQ